MKVLFTEFLQKNATEYNSPVRVLINQDKITERIFDNPLYQITVQTASALGFEQSDLLYAEDYSTNPEFYGENNSLVVTRYRKIGGVQVLEDVDIYGNLCYAYEQSYNGKVLMICTNDLNTGINEFEIEESYDDLMDLILVIPVVSDLSFDVTYDEAVILANTGLVVAGASYHITNAQESNAGLAYKTDIYLKGLDSRNFSTDGSRIHPFPVQAAYSTGVDGFGNSWIGVWANSLTPLADDLCVWGGVVFKNLTGSVGTASSDFLLDVVNWVLIDPVSYTNHEYVSTLFNIKYNITNDWITEQTDTLGNVVGKGTSTDLPFNPADLTMWNHPDMRDNKCQGGVYNNRADSIVSNVMTDYICKNVSTSINYNTGSSIENNVVPNIRNNKTNLIYDNVISIEILNNTGFSIFSNTTGTQIKDNFVSDINNNIVDTLINGNIGKLITNNTAASIVQNNVSEITYNGIITKATISYNFGYYIESSNANILNNKVGAIYNNTEGVTGNVAVQIKNNAKAVVNNVSVDILDNTGLVTNNSVDYITTNDLTQIIGCVGYSFKSNTMTSETITNCSFREISTSTLSFSPNNCNFLVDLVGVTSAGIPILELSSFKLCKKDATNGNVVETLTAGVLAYSPF